MKINEITERDVDSNFELSRLARKASDHAQKLRSVIVRVDSGQINLDDGTYAQLSRLADFLNNMGPGVNEFNSIEDVYDEMVHNTRIRNKGTDDDGVPFNKKSKDHEPEMTVDRFNMLMKLGK
jgi:hypothetical protein